MPFRLQVVSNEQIDKCLNAHEDVLSCYVYKTASILLHVYAWCSLGKKNWKCMHNAHWATRRVSSILKTFIGNAIYCISVLLGIMLNTVNRLWFVAFKFFDSYTKYWFTAFYPLATASNFTCKLWMMTGGTLFILGLGVKGQGQLWHSMYKALWAGYRLQFKFNHFTCKLWVMRSGTLLILGHKVKVNFAPLRGDKHSLRCIVMCEGSVSYLI